MIEDMGDVSHSVGIENWFIIAARGKSYNWVLTVIEPLVTLVNSSDFDHKVIRVIINSSTVKILPA